MKKWIQSVKCALKGIQETILSQRNMKIHIGMMLLVILAGILFRISTIEWWICILLFGAVMGMEVINTAIEIIVDRITMEKEEMARKAKDAGAGAVLIMAIVAAVIGLWIFIPKILQICIK